MHRDFVFALRQLRTNLRFSLIIVLTLALGIGATTAIFSVVSGVLLRALPFPESERLISLQTVVFPHGEAATTEAQGASARDGYPARGGWGKDRRWRMPDLVSRSRRPPRRSRSLPVGPRSGRGSPGAPGRAGRRARRSGSRPAHVRAAAYATRSPARRAHRRPPSRRGRPRACE